MIRVLHLSKYDGRGGAARAAAASVMGQKAIGIDAMLHAGLVERAGVAANQPGSLARIATLSRYTVERLPFRALRLSSHDVCSIGLMGERPETLERLYRPDLVMLHNVDGLVAIGAMRRFRVPLLWRLHDMWALGGIRHYWGPDDPPPSGLLGVLDRWTLRRKAHAYAQIGHLHLVPPSQWLAREASASPLTSGLPCRVIPNGIDTDVFRPINRVRARERLGLAGDGLVLAFGAASGPADPRKGFDLLQAALREADQALQAAGSVLLIFGGAPPAALASLQTRAIVLGRIGDPARLVDIYNAADLFLAPSRQENLSLMVLESLACGTPVMAFRIGGMPDMIRPGISGWLVPPFNVREMAGLLQAIVRETSLAEAMRASARSLAIRQFSTRAEALNMMELFQTLLTDRTPPGIANSFWSWS